MKKNKKYALLLLALAVVCVGLTAAYFAIPQKDKKEAGSQGDTTEANLNVATVDTDKIVGVSIEGGQSDGVHLSKESGSWKLKEHPSAMIETESVENMFPVVEKIEAMNELDGGNLAEYGLDEPALSVDLNLEDGSTVALDYGSELSTGSGYYVTVHDGNKKNDSMVYTVVSTMYSNFDKMSTDFIVKEQISGIQADYMTGVTIVKDGKISFRAKSVDRDKRVDPYTNWVIDQPLDRPLAGSVTDDWKTLMGYFTDVTFDTLVEYDCTRLGTYGLKDPDTRVDVDFITPMEGYELHNPITNEEEEEAASRSSNAQTIMAIDKVAEEYRIPHHYTLLIGKTAPDGSYYVRFDGSDQVYTINAQKIEAILDVDYYTYMDHSIYSILATDLEGYDVEIAGEDKIQVTRKDLPKEEGDTVDSKSEWKVNGAVVPDDKEQDFLTPYSKHYLLEFSQVAKKKKKENAKPVLTMTFHRKDKDNVIRYYPYDGTNFYRVDKDGMDYFLVDKRSIDAVIEGMKKLPDLVK